MLAVHGYRALGIDRSQVMIDLCRSRVSAGSFEKADVLNYTLTAHQHFDAIFAIFVTFALSHDRYARLLASFSTWLSPKGRLYLGTIEADDYPTEQSHFDTDSLYASGMDNDFMGKKVKISLLSKKGWESFLQQEGIQILAATTRSFAPH